MTTIVIVNDGSGLSIRSCVHGKYVSQTNTFLSVNPSIFTKSL